MFHWELFYRYSRQHIACRLNNTKAWSLAFYKRNHFLKPPNSGFKRLSLREVQRKR